MPPGGEPLKDRVFDLPEGAVPHFEVVGERSEGGEGVVVEAVDAVVMFSEDTPLELVLALRPNVIAKGGDYTVDTIVGAREVREWGGEAVAIPLTPGQSTTSIIEKLSGR